VLGGGGGGERKKSLSGKNGTQEKRGGKCSPQKKKKDIDELEKGPCEKRPFVENQKQNRDRNGGR